MPDIADSHHFDGISYIRHPASGGFAWPRGHERGGGGGLVVDWVRYGVTRWECAGIQCDYTHQALLVWRVISLNPVADR